MHSKPAWVEAVLGFLPNSTLFFKKKKKEIYSKNVVYI